MEQARFNISTDRCTTNCNGANTPAAETEMQVRHSGEPCAQMPGNISYRSGEVSARALPVRQTVVNTSEYCSSKNPRLRRAYRTYTPRVNNAGAPRS